SYTLTLSWTGSDAADGRYTAVFQSRSPSYHQHTWIDAAILDPERPVLPWDAYANNPIKTKATQQLTAQLRDYLKQRLPEHMRPSAFMVLDALPLTPNGKVDRRALPAPTSTRPVTTAKFVPPITALEKDLAAIWLQVLELDQIGIHDSFFELGGDSLRLMQLLRRVESAHRVVVSHAEFFKTPTIAGLVQQIRPNVPAAASTATGTATDDHMTLQQLMTEAVLDNRVDGRSLPRANWITPKAIFLTGATGFIGAFLLHELLQQTDAKIYCLVRAKTITQARQRLDYSFERYLPGVQWPYSRIIPVVGNLAKPRLGLSEQQFQAIAETVDTIYHSAANVNLFYPYSSLKAANVSGTHEILKLATSAKLKSVHYISTLDVFESLLSTGISVIHEDADIAQGDSITGGYAQSKWVAEQLVHLAAQRGVPTCIYRPGMVTGHSRSGVSNPEDLISRLLASFIQLQSAPQTDWVIDMTPVDYLSKAIAHISCQPTSIGKVFHLTNPNSL
ncbi:MAG TPA: thioester reductase domain-containing protein, partial [Crinalium sp.]